MAAGGHTTKEGLMSYLGIDGHERGNITAAAFYGRGAAAVLAAARAPARTAVESPGEEPAAKRPPSAADLRAFSVSPLAGPPRPSCGPTPAQTSPVRSSRTQQALAPQPNQMAGGFLANSATSFGARKQAV